MRVFVFQEFFKDLGELEGKLKALHVAYNFLMTVCDDSTVAEIKQHVDDIAERWRRIQRDLADHSLDHYNAGMQHISRWCDTVEIELSRHIGATHDNWSAQYNWLRVRQFCSLLPYISIWKLLSASWQ